MSVWDRQKTPWRCSKIWPSISGCLVEFMTTGRGLCSARRRTRRAGRPRSPGSDSSHVDSPCPELVITEHISGSKVFMERFKLHLHVLQNFTHKSWPDRLAAVHRNDRGTPVGVTEKMVTAFD